MNYMKKALLLICLVVGCSHAEPHKPSNLVENQTRLLNCMTQYTECLDRTRAFKGDVAAYDAAVNRCIKEAGECR
jgi:hypothetical protein